MSMLLERRATAQISQMYEWMARGWRKGAGGLACSSCGGRGVVWIKVEQRGRVERHRCSYCGHMQEYKVK